MSADRKRIDNAAPAYRAALQKRRQVRAVYESAREGDYHVLLSLIEGELPQLLIRMATPSRERASRSLRAFEPGAAAILAFLYGLSTVRKGQTEEAAPPDTAGQPKPQIVTHSPREHTLTAVLIHEDVRFELSLLLPDAGSAAAFQQLLGSPQVQAEAARRLFSLLCEEGEAP